MQQYYTLDSTILIALIKEKKLSMANTLKGVAALHHSFVETIVPKTDKDK